MYNIATPRTTGKYCILELGAQKALVTDPMTMAELNDFIKKKYGEQPLNYFNNSHSIWVIDMANREIRPLSVRIEI